MCSSIVHVLRPATMGTPHGTRVAVVEDCAGDCPGVTLTETRGVPWCLNGEVAVVRLVGRTGGFLLSRVFLMPVLQEQSKGV